MSLRRSPFLRRAVTLAASAALVLVCAASRADEAPPVPGWRPWFTLEAVGGLGTPLGFGGVESRYGPVPWVTVGAGAGANRSGAQLALMLWGTVVPSEVSFSFGAGESTGPYDMYSLDFSDSAHWHWERAWWTNIEMSFEYRRANGVDVRWFGGFAFLDDSGDGACANQDSCGGAAPGLAVFQSLIPYTGVSLGYAFVP